MEAYSNAKTVSWSYIAITRYYALTATFKRRVAKERIVGFLNCANRTQTFLINIQPISSRTD